MVYLTCGQLNLHKSDVCTGDFVRYLHDLSKSYRLTEFGSVKGMDHYGVISKPAREKQLLKIKEFVAKQQKYLIDKFFWNSNTKYASYINIIINAIAT